MSGPALFAVLMGVVVAFGIAMFWQESRRMRQPAAIYGVDDSIEWIWAGLGEDTLGLTRADVRRILEWEMYYLQQPDLWTRDGVAVVGGAEAAAYAQERAIEEGYAYEPHQIFAVLDLQATYLAAIGAVGDPADPTERIVTDEGGEAAT